MNNQISTTSSEASQKEQNQIILYRPNDTISLEVRLENETIWLTQAQIAELFGTKRPAITKHINNIYSSNELEANSTCSILEHMGNDGNQRINILEDKIDRKLAEQDVKIENLNKQVDFFVRTSLPPVEGVFHNGQIFDAYKFACVIQMLYFCK